jgi:uncharacterized protein involved in exopolysaccharide biosynthesis
MQKEIKSIPETVSLKNLLLGIKSWTDYILSKKKEVLIGTCLVFILTIAFNYLKTKSYYAKTSFVLENGEASGSGALSSLASISGLSLNGLMDGSNLFQIDNIQELYRSDRMLKQTLLTETDIEGTSTTILARFAKAQKLDKTWEKKGFDLNNFTPGKPLNRAQDSILKTVIKIVKENMLQVDKPGRKTSILELGIIHKDEALAKAFNESLIENVSKFYRETKTLQSSRNLKILQNQSDSIKTALDESISNLADIDERNPNPNPLVKSSQIPYQKAIIDVQANSAIYQEVLKQLEIAKVTQRNQQPLIQLIDTPTFPLQHNRWKLLKTLVFGLLIGFSVSIGFLSLKRIYDQLLHSHKS